MNDGIGLVYMNARYYVHGIGRFASADTIVPDPADPQAYNRYTYVRNSPMNYSDPTGHYWETAWDIANIGWGAYSLKQNISDGKYGAATIDGIGLVVDVVAVLARRTFCISSLLLA